MDFNESSIPGWLQDFIAQGKIIEHDTGDWKIEMRKSDKKPWKNIPSGALIFANNGYGDVLFLKQSVRSGSWEEAIYVYWHEESRFEVFAKDFNYLLNPPPDTYRPIYYSDGKTQVLLGDKVSARLFFFRKTGVVTYVPGYSLKKRDMEHGGLWWVGIKFDDGSALISTVVLPETFRLKKGIRFLGRKTQE